MFNPGLLGQSVKLFLVACVLLFTTLFYELILVGGMGSLSEALTKVANQLIAVSVGLGIGGIFYLQERSQCVP